MSEPKFDLTDEEELEHAQNLAVKLIEENDALEARIKELEKKLNKYEWKDIKDAPGDGLVLVDSSNITNRRAGENVALASWFYYDGLACWRDDNNEKIEPQPHRYMEFTPPTQE